MYKLYRNRYIIPIPTQHINDKLRFFKVYLELWLLEWCIARFVFAIEIINQISDKNFLVG